MTYKIGEFCRMVGLPRSKVRFYEKCGLLRDHQGYNGYHYYTHQDAFRVNAFLNLLQYGFTVERAIAMLDEKQSTETFRASLVQQREDLERQIELLTFRKQKVAETLDHIDNRDRTEFEVRHVDPYLYVPASNGLDFSPSAENATMIERFYSVLEVSRCARIIRRADLLGDGEEVNPSYVIAIPEPASYLLGRFKPDAVRRLEMGKCIIYYRSKTRRESARRASYLPLLAYLKDHGLAIRDDLLLLPSFLNLDGHGLDVEELLVPVT